MGMRGGLDSVVDPDPNVFAGSGSEYKFYKVKYDFSCIKNQMSSLNTYILTLKFVERTTSVLKQEFSHS